MQSFSSLSAKSPVVRIDDGADRFLLSLSYATYEFNTFVYDAFLFDIRGGIKAHQWGMVYFAARNALRCGIRVYLLSKGFNLPSTPLPQLMLRMLSSAVGDAQELYHEARDLEFANPNTPEEIQEYAHRCTTFVEKRLGIEWLWEFGSTLASNAGQVRLQSIKYHLIRALQDLGVNYRGSTETVVRNMERQYSIREKLWPAPPGEPRVDFIQ